MGREIQFTSNYSDLSTNQGFQFEFTCDRCGTGYRTEFKTWKTGTISSALDTASSLFGEFSEQPLKLAKKFVQRRGKKPTMKPLKPPLRKLSRISGSARAVPAGYARNPAGIKNADYAKDARRIWV